MSVPAASSDTSGRDGDAADRFRAWGRARRWPPSPRGLASGIVACLGLLLVTGAPLAFVYELSTRSAHAGVLALDTGPLWWLRSGHAWAAGAAVVLAALHVVRSYVGNEVRRLGRRRGLAGVALFAVLLGAFFTGTILPWDQQGWEAYQLLESGWFAFSERDALQAPAEASLALVFWSHVVGIPLVLLLGIGVHVHRRKPDSTYRRLAVLMRGRGRQVLVMSAVLFALALLWRPVLGPAPTARLRVTLPEWPFLWLIPLQDAFGPVALWTLPFLFVVGAALVWWGHETGLRVRASVALGVIMVWAGLSVWAVV